MMIGMVPNLSEYRKHYDGLPATFIVTQYMIKSKGNQVVSANIPLLEVSSISKFYCLTIYNIALNVNTVN